MPSVDPDTAALDALSNPQLPQLLGPRTTHRKLLPATHLGRHPSLSVPEERDHVVEVHEMGPVDPHEPLGIEPRLQPAQRHREHVPHALRLRDDVVAIGLEPRDRRHRHGEDRRPAPNEHPAQVSLVECFAEPIERRLRGRLAKRDAHPFQRRPEALRTERLEQIVHRAQFERGHRVLRIRGREHDEWPMRESLDDLRAEQAGHLDVEEHEFGPKRLDRADCGPPVCSLPHHLDPVEGSQHPAWTGARATSDLGGGTLGNPFPVTAVPAETTLLTPRVTQGRWLLPSDSLARVVNDGVLRGEPTWRVGARIPIIVGGRSAEWTIVGVVETSPGPMAYAERGTIAAMVSDGRATSVVVRSTLRGQASQLDLIQRLRTALLDSGVPVASSSLVTEARSAVEDHLLMVVDFLGGMAWLMILVGVLRAIGARHGAILALIQVEGLTIALLSWALAVPLSIPVSVLPGNAFGRIMFRVPVTYVPNGTGVAIWLGLVVVVSALACAWPAARAMRIPTAAALAYE